MGEKLKRIFELLRLLETGRPDLETLWTVLRVDRRTVLRDIEELKELGFIIQCDKKTLRYRLVGSKILPETQLSLEEAIALITLCFETGDDRNIPFFHAARMAALKLHAALPKPLQENVYAHGNVLKIRREPVNPLQDARSVFDRLVAAIQARRSVRIRYKSPVEPEIEVLLNGYVLFFCRHSWYVVGYSNLHRETRMFHLGRIRSCEKTEEPYAVPKGFTLEKYLGNAWRLIREPGPDRDVVIRFSPLVGQNVSEVLWHSTQRILANDDGSIDFHVTVSGLREISWWVLGYGKEAKVLKPRKLRDMILHHAEELVRMYQDE